MSAVVYVSRDAAALSVGAERVATMIAREAASRGIDLTLKRNGTRGMCWLEPLVEVVVGSERYGYGPVTERDLPGLFAADFLHNGAHTLRLGRVDDIPYFASQQRLTFERVGVVEPTNLADYLRHGGYEGLHNALRRQPQEIVQEVTESGLRGRGGAAFPTGIKWKTVLDTPAPQKYVTCNADEGDSGTFSDRMLMEGDPFLLIEGMTIAALAVGATHGYIYLRIEYPHAARAGGSHSVGLQRRVPWPGCGGQWVSFRSRSALGRRRIHLRRRDLDAREPGGSPRRSACPAAIARRQGPLRTPHDREQCDLTRERADHSPARCAVLS